MRHKNLAVLTMCVPFPGCELTLDRAVRLRQAALEEPELRLPWAMALAEYHVRRNEVARRSHAKTWRAQHRGVKSLRL